MSQTPQINENNSDTGGEKKEKNSELLPTEFVCFDFLAWPF